LIDVEGRLRRFIHRQAFRPGPLAIFLNPFYLARHGLLEAVSQFAPHISGRTLDVGCGTKPYESLFEVSEYIGLEIDSTQARQHSSADVFYDGGPFPFESASFDSVVCNQTLEHVFEPGAFIAEIARVLRPGGALLLTVPFVWDEHEQPADYGRYSSFGLRYLIERNGLRVVGHRKVGADASTLLQLVNAYIFKVAPSGRAARMVVSVLVHAPVTIVGLLLKMILPKNPDLFLDQVLLAEKPA
jgi:SAM-dependent methyltransferase